MKFFSNNLFIYLDVLNKINSEVKALCPWNTKDRIKDILTISNVIKENEKGGFVQVKLLFDYIYSQFYLKFMGETIVCHCERQLSTIKAVLDSNKQPLILHLDATGSIIRACSKTFLFSLCAQINIKKIKAFPLIEWLSSKHDRFSIAERLMSFEFKMRSILPKPSLIVSDFSWALLHAISEGFCKKSIKQQLVCQWHSMIGQNKCETIIRMCANHLIAAFIRRINVYNLPREVFILCINISIFSG